MAIWQKNIRNWIRFINNLKAGFYNPAFFNSFVVLCNPLEFEDFIKT